MQHTSCAVCGETFTPVRAGVQYCSPACKQRAYRLRLNGTPLPPTKDQSNQEEMEEEDGEESQFEDQEEGQEEVEETEGEQAHMPERKAPVILRTDRIPTAQKPAPKRSAAPSPPRGVEEPPIGYDFMPVRFPWQYYLPSGNLSPLGWEGVHEMDRKALRHKPKGYTDFQWLEAKITDNGVLIDPYEQVKREQEQEHQRKERAATAVPTQPLSRVQRSACRQFEGRLIEWYRRLLEWDREEQITPGGLGELREEMKQFRRSSTYVEIAQMHPRGDFFEHLHSRIKEHHREIEKSADNHVRKHWDELSADMEFEDDEDLQECFEDMVLELEMPFELSDELRDGIEAELMELEK